MLVTCDKCGARYDDALRWTICPHNRLEVSFDTPYYNCGNPGYCAGHDLYNCPCEPPDKESS